MGAGFNLKYISHVSEWSNTTAWYVGIKGAGQGRIDVARAKPVQGARADVTHGQRSLARELMLDADGIVDGVGSLQVLRERPGRLQLLDAGESADRRHNRIEVR